MIQIHEVINGVLALWHVIAPFIPFALVGGAVSSVALEFTKNWFIDPKHKRAVTIMKNVIVGVTVALHAWLAAVPDNAASVVLRGLLTTGATSGLYLLFLKPAYAALDNAVTTYKTGKAVKSGDNPQLPTTTHTFEA